MNGKYAILLSLLLLAQLLLPGCQASSPSPVTSSGASAIPVPEDDGNAGSLTLGILYPMAHPYYEMITTHMEESARQHRVRLIVKAPAELNLEQQLLMMENMIRQKVDAIAISPIDSEQLAPVIDKAVQQGIPVICFEADVPLSKRASYIGSDAYQEGRLMGEMINRQLKGKGMIMIQGGLEHSVREQTRLDGMLAFLKANTRVQILEVRYHNGQSELALAELETMIDDHPHFDALVTLDIISSSTSILVWKAQGLKRFAFSYGLTPEVKEALINGQIHAVISENEEQLGERIIGTLLQAAAGTAIPDWINSRFQEVTGQDLDGST
ncbi:sugar ABC transporter substrate-binding protein [Paenibacillus mesotrionivorans]|uniref:Sugar ABC transporter substrate-binding protein n=1 Tax=Paenibacillus mesotrionivorans TaxID=3160968 RepID=A0ACC7P267_9BACL